MDVSAKRVGFGLGSGAVLGGVVGTIGALGGGMNAVGVGLIAGAGIGLYAGLQEPRGRGREPNWGKLIAAGAAPCAALGAVAGAAAESGFARLGGGFMGGMGGAMAGAMLAGLAGLIYTGASEFAQ